MPKPPPLTTGESRVRSRLETHLARDTSHHLLGDPLGRLPLLFPPGTTTEPGVACSGLRGTGRHAGGELDTQIRGCYQQ